MELYNKKSKIDEHGFLFQIISLYNNKYKFKTMQKFKKY